jgi:hypothetical protein
LLSPWLLDHPPPAQRHPSAAIVYYGWQRLPSASDLGQGQLVENNRFTSVSSLNLFPTVFEK